MTLLTHLMISAAVMTVGVRVRELVRRRRLNDRAIVWAVR